MTHQAKYHNLLPTRLSNSPAQRLHLTCSHTSSTTITLKGVRTLTVCTQSQRPTPNSSSARRNASRSDPSLQILPYVPVPPGVPVPYVPVPPGVPVPYVPVPPGLPVPYVPVPPGVP
eukprot:1158806-Pelagomonas_calceolata.AAC.1